MGQGSQCVKMKAEALDYKKLGGAMMPMAKSIRLETVGDVGDYAPQHDYVPQHYYVYHQTLDSLNTILACMTSLPNLLLFAGEDQGGLYLQAGVIGHENYQLPGKSAAAKLVYGRKWRIDQDTPTSEIVQTALLALQKVREHEVRELLVWQDPASGRASTPFSCHQDIQLLTRQLSRQSAAAPHDTVDIPQLLAQLQFGSRRLTLQNLQTLADGRLLADIQLGAAPDHFAEFDHQQISLLIRRFSPQRFMHDLMDALIHISHNHCRNTFLFCQVPRFSQEVDPRVIGALSVKSRPYQAHMADTEFFRTFSHINFSIDQGRVPQLGRGVLADINRRALVRHGPLEGHLPAGLVSDYAPRAVFRAQARAQQELSTEMAGPRV